MKEKLNELLQTMLREHPELEEMRKTMNNYMGLVFFFMIAGLMVIFIGYRIDSPFTMIMGVVIIFGLNVVIILIQDKKAPYFTYFEEVLSPYLPEMLTHLPEAGWTYYGPPPSREEVLNCGLFTKDERRRQSIDVFHWMEGTYKGYRVRMGNVASIYQGKRGRVVKKPWQTSTLLWISYPEGPSGAVQVFPRRIVDWAAGDKHTRDIRRGVLKVMPTMGKRFEVNFPGLKARFAAFDVGGLAQGWLNNRANLDRLKRFQQQQPNRLCFMALKDGQLAILLFGQELFKTIYAEPLRYADVFNVYHQQVLDTLKLVDGLEEQEVPSS